ncbi:MAG: toxin-antitoxin (TA) system antitoxin [Anaerolineae bacterium]|nr:toxin-antitoxin (TA) system antitoxin [Anaerolineae bacterium]
MATKTVDIQDAQTQLTELLDLALQGTEVIFARDNMPLARLTAVDAVPGKKRVAGLHEGAIWTSEDFDDPLPDEFWLGVE